MAPVARDKNKKKRTAPGSPLASLGADSATELAEVSLSSLSSEESDRESTTESSPRASSKKKTVAMSIGSYPRLSANGKRIGRPPGTFKVTKMIASNYKEPKHNVPIVCKWDHCDCVFLSIEQIVKHVYNAHARPQAKIACMWEGCYQREFRSYYMLVGHLRCHTGERPMKCPYEECGKTYKTRENLTTHIRTHTGERPYLCQKPNCVKAFTNASDRAKHENRYHSNSKKYACDVEGCTKRYTDPSSLRKHIICIHGPEVMEAKKKAKLEEKQRQYQLKKSLNSAGQPVRPAAPRKRKGKRSAEPVMPVQPIAIRPEPLTAAVAPASGAVSSQPFLVPHENLFSFQPVVNTTAAQLAALRAPLQPLIDANTRDLILQYLNDQAAMFQRCTSGTAALLAQPQLTPQMQFIMNQLNAIPTAAGWVPATTLGDEVPKEEPNGTDEK